MDWNEASKHLSQPLDPRHVKKPTGNFGPKGEYIEGWHAIAEANRIFGFGGWSYATTLTREACEQVTVTKRDRDGNERQEKQWQAAYTCLCRVTVGDVAREDVGFGSGFAKQIGDAIEGATKEAVTDALKRCLRTFGNPFGLALYDKARANVGVPFDAPDVRDRLKAALERLETPDEVKKFWGQKRTTDALAQLPAPMAAEVKHARDRRMDELQGPPSDIPHQAQEAVDGYQPV